MRNTRKLKRGRRDFAFSGLITCGHCGCAIVGEMKKGRYVYYHCTGYKGTECRKTYVREEVLEKRYSAVLGRLSFGDEVQRSLDRALRESHDDERREHEDAIARLQAEAERLQKRIHAAYLDKLDGSIDRALFERMSEEWREKQRQCEREIAWHRTADQSYLKEGARLLDLARSAERLFVKQEPREKRKLLNFLLSNSILTDGELNATLRQPFDLLAETTAIVVSGSGKNGLNSPEHPSWLGN